MSTLLITGSGMLASALCECAHDRGLTVHVFSREQLDVTDRQAVLAAVGHLRPSLILHTAALTRVHYCEEHPDEAQRVNAQGTEHVVEAAGQAMATLIYFSTDYVFDGRQNWPYQEDAPPNPLNAYGRSKLAGEQAVAEYFRGHIVRTSGVFGVRAGGKPERNFFRAVALQLLIPGLRFPVVADQQVAVTHAPHLAGMVFALLAAGLPRVVHLTSAGSDSWRGWACRAAIALGEPPERIIALNSADTGDATVRPAYSVLASGWSPARGAIAMHPAGPAVEAYVKSLRT
jgi:dTDP-4-dehydrorhamnose reductase